MARVVAINRKLSQMFVFWGCGAVIVRPRLYLVVNLLLQVLCNLLFLLWILSLPQIGSPPQIVSFVVTIGQVLPHIKQWYLCTVLNLLYVGVAWTDTALHEIFPRSFCLLFLLLSLAFGPFCLSFSLLISHGSGRILLVFFRAGNQFTFLWTINCRFVFCSISCCLGQGILVVFLGLLPSKFFRFFLSLFSGSRKNLIFLLLLGQLVCGRVVLVIILSLLIFVLFRHFVSICKKKIKNVSKQVSMIWYLIN